MIWCAEDDNATREIELYALHSVGFEAKGFADGTAFLTALAEDTPSLAVLDIMLPGTDGLEILRQMRNSPKSRKVPVIMATAKGEEYDKITGLDGGADYYLTKPFGVMEFISCVKAVLRRCECELPDGTLHDGMLSLNTDSRTVRDGEREIPLTYKEFELLRLFLSHPGHVFSREELIGAVWSTDYMGESRTLDMHMKTLRRKLEAHGNKIVTVRGVGYRWEE